jgi:hypothetical protein
LLWFHQPETAVSSGMREGIGTSIGTLLLEGQEIALSGDSSSISLIHTGSKNGLALPCMEAWKASGPTPPDSSGLLGVLLRTSLLLSTSRSNRKITIS